MKPKNTHNETLKGFLLLYKPKGISSFSVIPPLRNALKCRKIGHTGTLDPLASGLLILAVGKATKTISLLHELPKTYLATIHLGEERDTDDAEGVVSKTFAEKYITEMDIKEAMDHFRGILWQMPPAYSAKKIHGKRAYEVARKGEQPVMNPSQVTVYSIELVSFEMPQLVLRIACSTGTYIRSIARDLGRTLGSGAYLSGLIRESIGQFSLTHPRIIAFPLEHPLDWQQSMLSLHDTLYFIPSLELKEENLYKIQHGIHLHPFDFSTSMESQDHPYYKVILHHDNDVLAIVDQNFKYEVVLI